MSWFKRKRESRVEPNQGPVAGQPVYLYTKTQSSGAVYEIYRSADAEVAKAFLTTKRVDRDLHYVVVETPRGNWGMDVEGLYLENLLPWQLDTSAADCVGRIHLVTNTFGLSPAARGITDNFVAQIQCGGCGHLWHDGLRYQNDTLVRCPHCATLNSVDSSGVTVSTQPDPNQPDRQVTMVITSHDIADDAGGNATAISDHRALLAGADQTIPSARAAVDATPAGHPYRPGRLFHLGNALEERFKHTGELADLDAAIIAFIEAADLTPAGDNGLAERRIAVSRTRYHRFERTGRLTDLDPAIAAMRAAVASTPPADPEHPDLLSGLGVALRERFELTGRLADLDHAVTAGREAVAGTPTDNPAYLANLSATLRVRFEHTGRPDDLDDAIGAGRAAVSDSGHPARVACLSSLGLALQERFTYFGDLADLEEAIAAFTEAVTTASYYWNHAGLKYNLGRGLLARFERLGRTHDLDNAITAAREALEAVAQDDPNRAKLLSLLGHSMITRFRRAGGTNDLDDGVAAYRKALEALPAGHSDYPLYRHGLGTALLERFQGGGQLNDLAESIAAARDAVNATAEDHPDRPKYQDTLGAALQSQFRHTGQLADLDAAIAAGRAAVAGISPEYAHYYSFLSNLSFALSTRFRHTGRLPDLDDAVTAIRNAMTTTPPDHGDHYTIVNNVGEVLMERYLHTGNPGDLDEAISAHREAVAGAPPDHALRPIYLHGFSFALRTRYSRNGRADDLAEALATGREAVAGMRPSRTDRAGALVNLSVVLHFQFERGRDVADLNDAIATAREAVATTPDEHPAQAEHLSILGGGLWTRFGHLGQRTDLEDAVAAFLAAVNVESGQPEVRMAAARMWAKSAIGSGQPDSAADGFAAAVRLLPQYVWHGLPRDVREKRVASWSGLAADAAACAILAGRPEQAVELLEAGRSVLWAQQFNLRADFTNLDGLERTLANRLDQIRTLLDAPLPTTPGADQHHEAVERMRLATEFDDLIGQVRAVQGFEHFLAPASFAELCAAASAGPVVIVNTSRYGCHALVVDGGVRVVELPDLTYERAVGQANTLLGILTSATGPNRPFLERERDRHAVLDILAWLWDTIAEPVLNNLGYTEPPAPDAAWPRIWWCPTGRLALLPLHAAGHHPRHQTADPAGTDTVLDRVISSYTPTLSALLRARVTPATTETPALLAIGMPTTPGHNDLPAVPAELDRIHARYRITTRLQSAVDSDDQPTIARVLAELPRHAWVHFSCHGSQHFSDPTASAFWLIDGPLHIGDLIQNDTGPRELAFLSACETATGSLRAADEAIHLAASMQFLGYRNVIATLWSIYDAPAADFADSVYSTLGATDPPDVAFALHRAIAALRARWRTDPLVWAPYLHAGR